MNGRVMGLVYTCAALVLPAAAWDAVYVQACGSTGVVEAGRTWNLVPVTSYSLVKGLKDATGESTSVAVQVLEKALDTNTSASKTYVGEAAEFEAVRQAMGGLQCFAIGKSWGGHAHPNNIRFRLTGLDPRRYYRLSFAGQRTGSDASGYVTRYAVQGANAVSTEIESANQTERVGVVNGALAREDGSLEVTVSAGTGNRSSGLFSYLQAWKIEVVTPSLPAQDIYVDAADTAASDTKTWNNVSFGSTTVATSLRDASGAPTSVGIVVTKPGVANNKSATKTLSGEATEFEAARRNNLQVYGCATAFSGNLAPEIAATVSGLETTATYDFTFMAARDATDTERRSGRYAVSGANDCAVESFDATRNTSAVCTVSGVRPKADGTAQISITPAMDNANAYKFYYLLAFKISRREQELPSDARLVTAQAVPAAGGTVSNAGGLVAADYSATCTATANAGYRFVGWTSDTGDSAETPSIVLSGAASKNWTAVFEPDTGARQMSLVLVDATQTPGQSALVWNKTPNLFAFDAVSGPLLQTNGVPSGAWLSCVRPVSETAINGNATTPLTGEAAVFEPARNGGKQLYMSFRGNGKENAILVYDVKGLDPQRAYTLTFAASRMSAAAGTDYRTRYVAKGANTVVAEHNPANTATGVGRVPFVVPTAEGTIRVELSAAPGNTNADLYFYLLAFGIEGDFSQRAEDAWGRRILWFGNSFSTNGIIPRRVENLAVLAGFKRPYIVMDLMGGKNLAYHIGELKNNPKDNIEEPGFLYGQTNDWDDVVIQGYSTEATHIYSPLPEDGFIPNATNLYALVRHSKRGKRVRGVLYETWARHPSNSDFYPSQFADAVAMQREITANYKAACNLLNDVYGDGAAVVAPVGTGFRRMNFARALYHTDLYHQDWNGYGCELLAMVLFNRIYDTRVGDHVTYAQAKAAGWTQATEAQWNEMVEAARRAFVPAGLISILR